MGRGYWEGRGWVCGRIFLLGVVVSYLVVVLSFLDVGLEGVRRG